MSVRLRPAVGVTLGIIVFALGAGALWIWSPWGSASQDAPEAAAPETVTVPVVLGTLTQQLRLNATLGYGAPLELLASTGTITALPAPGQVISAGEPAYELQHLGVQLERTAARQNAEQIAVYQLAQRVLALGKVQGWGCPGNDGHRVLRIESRKVTRQRHQGFNDFPVGVEGEGEAAGRGHGTARTI